MAYNATERQWVARILRMLTPTERTEYERRMREAKGHPNNGKKYDGLKARVAEEVIVEFRLKQIANDALAARGE